GAGDLVLDGAQGLAIPSAEAHHRLLARAAWTRRRGWIRARFWRAGVLERRQSTCDGKCPSRRGLSVCRIATLRLPYPGHRPREERAGTRAVPRELPDSRHAAITGKGPCVRRFGAPVGQEQPAVVEEHD